MLRKTIIRNASSSFAAQAIGAFTAIFITPFIVRSLGQSVYGLWMLVASFVGYFGMTDFGLRSAVGRFIALYRAKNDPENMNRVIVTALVLLSAACVLIIIVTLASSLFFTRMFHVESAQDATAQQLLLLIGISFALAMPLEVFDGILVGHGRYDWINGLEILASLSRAGSAVALLSSGYGVLALAWSNLAITLSIAAVKIVLTYKLFPQLQLAVRFLTKPVAKEMLGFSCWFFILVLCAQFAFQSDSIIVGWALNTEAVAVYSIAGRLVKYAMMGSTVFIGILMPLATAYHAKNDLQSQHQLFFKSTKACLFYACFIGTVFVFCGRSLIMAWVGTKFEYSATILLVLTAPMIAWILEANIGVAIFSMGRLKWFALIRLADSLANVGLSMFLVKRWGMIGVAYGTFFTTCLTMLFIVPAYGCRILQIPIADYLRETHLPVVAAVIPLIGGFYAAKIIGLPTRPLPLAALIAGIGAAYFGAVYHFHFAAKQPTRVAIA